MGVIDDVKARLDIVDVIGGYVPLRKAGRTFKAPCPFHNEKTPSFIVNPDRQTWHCFGACGTGGDVFAFITRKENLDFSGALRLLADRAGVELHAEGPRREQLKTLYDVNEAAALYFHSLLLRGGPGLEYAESRGLDRATLADFQMGFSPPGWDNLRNHLTGRGYAEEQLIESGLIIASERGGYDRFRGRLMVPIRDERGRVIGFGARILPSILQGQDEGPKYINTPQGPIFDKGSVLYALDRAKDEIRRDGTAVIVEGYMDVITAHEHGFRNVVASMGTSLTERQALLAQRFAGTIVLAMDADEAGSAANLRGIQVVAGTAERSRAAARGGRNDGRPQQRALDIRVATLPQGVDPDELVRGDAKAWPELIAGSRPVVEHLFAVVRSGLDLQDARQRSQLVTEILPAIGDVVDPVVQADYLQRLSRLARVDEDTLRRQLRADRPRPARPQAAPTGAPMEETAVQPMRAVGSPREEFCLALLFRVPEVAILAADVSEDLFSLSENRELFRRWQSGQAVEEGEAGIWDQYQRLQDTRLAVIETGQAEAAFLDCVRRLEQSKMKEVKEASALALAEGEAGVRPGQVASIARERWEAGIDTTEDADESAPEQSVAAQLLKDMEAGLRFHRRLIDSSRPEAPGESSAERGPAFE